MKNLLIKNCLQGLVLLFVFAGFLQVASANHGSFSIRGCSPAPSNQSAYDNCLAEISDYCSQQELDTGVDSNTCYSSLSSDVRVVSTAPTAPAASGVETLNNPLAIDSMQDLFEAIMTAFIILCTPVIVFFVIYAGFQYVTARGNPEKIQSASKALLYAIIGAVIIIGAIAITTIVGNTVNEFN